MSANASAQGPHGARPLPPGIRVNQIATLPHLTDQQKQAYTRGVANLYDTISKHEKESQEYKTAAQKLMEFTQKMGKEVKEWKERQAAAVAANAQQQQGDRPQSQGQPGQPQQQPQAQPQQANAGQSANQPAAQQVAPKIMQHVQSFTYYLPPNIAAGTAEAESKIKEMKSTYAAALARSEQMAGQVKKLQAIAQERQAQGQEIPSNWQQQKQALEAQWQNAQRFIQEFRQKQDQYKNLAQQAQAQAQAQPPQQSQQPQPQPAAPQQQQQSGPQIKAEGGTSTPGQPPSQAMPTQIPGQPNQQQQQQQQQPGQASTPAMNNPAVEAARQQLNPAARPPMSPATGVQQQQSQQQQPQQQQLGQAQPSFHQGTPTPQGPQAAPGQMPQQTPNVNVPRPQINPQQAAQMNQMHQNSPHTQHTGPPVPLTHGQAMSAAARTYSDQRATPQIPAAQGYQMGSREPLTNPKMPIPKTLNVPPPHPVNMGPARPTLGGPTNGAPGMMGQPVIAAHPQYHLEGDGERVLSKKKLDELVRQVTGGGEGPAGESLTPEVEEAMLQLADDFLDNVITSACKLAKLRESSTLEIRDIQSILERNYNIRIPGYASDEIRTVRKFQPAPGWTAKMNAVQAAKVMGGKTD